MKEEIFFRKRERRIKESVYLDELGVRFLLPKCDSLTVLTLPNDDADANCSPQTKWEKQQNFKKGRRKWAHPQHVKKKRRPTC